MRISLVRFFTPASWLPSKSTRHMSSGFMKPLLTSVGVQSAMSSPTRIAMLPPLPSTYARCHNRRPISHICSFKFWQYGELKNASSSAFELFELNGFAGAVNVPLVTALALAVTAPFDAGLPVISKSRIKSRADGVRITSSGSERTSWPARCISSRSRTLMTCFMLKILNSEIRGPKSERIPNPEAQNVSRAAHFHAFGFRISIGFRPSDFISFLKRRIKNLIHQRRIDRINRRRLVKRRRRFRAFDKSNRLPNSAAQIVIYDEAGVLAHPRRRFRALLKMLAREWAHDQK